MEMISTPIKLAAHGLSRKDLDVLRSLLLLYRSRLSRECQLCCDDDEADLHLIDVDEPVGRTRWETLRARKRCIVFSRNAVEAPLLLGKPLRGPALLAVLSEVSYQTKHAAQAAQPDKILTGTYAQLASTSAATGKQLICLLETGTINSQVRIVVPGDGDDGQDDLWIDPELRQYLLGTALARLRNFLRLPLQPEQIQRVSRQEFREQTQRVRPKTLTRLQWFSALACSNGELLPPLSRSSPVQLTAWPDMEGHSPSFFRLAGLLVKQAVAFDGIIAMTGIDSGTTADFVNASYRSGLMREVAPRESVGSGMAFAGRSIVARLRERLGL
jgi:hypothetical protein